MKRLFLTLLLTAIFNSTILADEPQVNAQAALLMDINSGRVLWSKNAAEPMAMASTTKIMTAVIALEQGNLQDIVTVGKNAVLAPKVKMYLQEGEKITLENLLYALMLQSSNDAAVAVAEHIGGSVEGFADLMNAKAAEIGCTDTYFVTPNGLDSGNHHSTAYDMALITRYALNNAKFVEIINTKNITFSSDKKTYSLTNKDRLLNEYEGAFGVKTGFTGKAGHCFVGAAKREDKAYISVVLASGWGSSGKEKKWSDTKAILNYAFENFEYKEIVQKNFYAGNISVLNSHKAEIPLVLNEGFTTLVNKDNSEKINVLYLLPDSIEAPVEKGSKIGIACVTLNGETIKNINVVAAENADCLTFCDYVKRIFLGWIDWVNNGII